MVCAKCGKKISSFSDDCFCEVIDDKKDFLCKNCHDEYLQNQEMGERPLKLSIKQLNQKRKIRDLLPYPLKI